MSLRVVVDLDADLHELGVGPALAGALLRLVAVAHVLAGLLLLEQQRELLLGAVAGLEVVDHARGGQVFLQPFALLDLAVACT